MIGPHEIGFLPGHYEIDRESHNETCASLPVVRASELVRQPPQPRSWIVDGLIPANTVSFFSGDGGLGKSLLALQLAVAIVSKTDWLGLKCTEGPVLFVTAEDDNDEVARRLGDVCRSKCLSPEALNDLHILCLVDRDTAFAEQTEWGVRFNDLFRMLAAKAKEINSRLVVIDPLAAFYGGDDVSRVSANGFVRGLVRQIATKNRAVLVIAHPSVDAMRSNRPMSGSTGWSNASRSVIYIEAVKDRPGRRKVFLAKANYAARAHFDVEWRNGCFSPISSDQVVKERSGTDDLFVALLQKSIDRGQTVSGRHGRNFAPKIFEKSDEATKAGITKAGLTKAMERLLKNGSIVEVNTGYQSAPRYQLIIRATA